MNVSFVPSDDMSPTLEQVFSATPNGQFFIINDKIFVKVDADRAFETDENRLYSVSPKTVVVPILDVVCLFAPNSSPNG